MAKYISILDKVREKLKTQTLPGAQRQAVSWYRAQIKSLGGATREHLLADRARSKNWFYPGGMYLFVYDPKTKETLPYYDKFPLVLPLEFYRDGFLGINLHYLDYRTRLSLFHNLLSLVEQKTLNENTRMQLSYRILSGVSRFKAFKPCIKRYLSSHVQSQAIKINAPDWETALFLPVENFSKKSKTKVWQDSTDIIAGRSPQNMNVIPHTSYAVGSHTSQPVIGTKKKDD